MQLSYRLSAWLLGDNRENATPAGYSFHNLEDEEQGLQCIIWSAAAETILRPVTQAMLQAMEIDLWRKKHMIPDAISRLSQKPVQ
jgi:hypothetical protein